MMRIALVLGVSLLVSRFAPADEPSYDCAVKPLLEKHCVLCHGPEKAKGDLRLDGAAPDLANAKARGVWEKVHCMLVRGVMPPPQALDRRTRRDDHVDSPGERMGPDRRARRREPDVLLGNIRRNVRKMANLRTASVYRRRVGTNVFEFVRTEPEAKFEKLLHEGYFDGTVCQRGC